MNNATPVNTYSDPNVGDRYVYDANGDTLRHIDSQGNTTRTVYDTSGRVIQVIFPDEYFSDEDGLDYSTPEDTYANPDIGERYSYNQDGKILSYIDNLNNSTYNVYDANDNLIRSTLNNSFVTRYIYNSDNELMQEIYPNQYDSSLDGLNNTTPVNTYGNPNIGDRYTYDAKGNMLTHIDSENNITSDTYDPNNKKIKQIYNNSLITRYIYDSNGNLIQQINPDQYDSTKDGWINSTSPNTYSDPNVGDRYTYDDNGNMLTHTDSNNKVTAYTYDGNNNIATATLPDGSVFTYDSTGEIVSEQYPNGITNTTNYNIDGTISGVTSSNNNYSTQYGYDSNGNINQFTETFGTNVGNTTYTYDSIGNIKTISVGGVLRATYTYDTNNELIREDNAWLGESIVYGYDSNGNMLTKKIYAYTTGTVEFLVVTHTNYYNSQNQLERNE